MRIVVLAMIVLVGLSCESETRAPGGGTAKVFAEIVAQKYHWLVRYPGDDLRFGTADDVYCINELLIPDELDECMVRVTSKDVPHRLVATNRHYTDEVSHDLVGSTVDVRVGTETFWTVPRRVECFACGEYCGPGYFCMEGPIRRVEKAEFRSAIEVLSRNKMATGENLWANSTGQSTYRFLMADGKTVGEQVYYDESGEVLLEFR